MRNIVLGIPHSSVSGMFCDDLGRWPHDPGFVNDCVNKWTDWHTDFLFNIEHDRKKAVIFSKSRFVCDAERLEHDDMERIGQGIIYTRFGNYTRGELTDESKRELKGLWLAYQAALRNALDSQSVLIDCHSFPSELDDDCDICIGYNEDWSRDDTVVELVKGEFEAAGYKVKLNAPYSNAITPKCDFPYKSLMIEVNKRIYLDEATLQLKCDLARWFGCINSVYDKIIAL